MPNITPKKNVGLIQKCPECGTEITTITCDYDARISKEACLVASDSGAKYIDIDTETNSEEIEGIWQCPECGEVLVDTSGMLEEETEEILETYMKTGVLPDGCRPCESG